MKYIQIRIFALVIVLVGAFLIHINWRQLHSDGQYSTKLAAFSPLMVVGGIFLLFFPTRFGKPETVGEKIVVMAVFVIGLLAGLVNWYLMDPGFFGL